jgi:WD40 repeat protein
MVSNVGLFFEPGPDSTILLQLGELMRRLSPTLLVTAAITLALILNIGAVSTTGTAAQGDKKDLSAEEKSAGPGKGMSGGPPFLQMQLKSTVMCVAWSPDGKLMAAGTSDALIIIFETASGAEKRLIATNGPVASLAFSSDGARLVSIGLPEKAMKASIWEIDNGKERKDRLGSTVTVNTEVERVALTPDDQGVIGVRVGGFAWRGSGGGGMGSSSSVKPGGSSSIAPDASVSGWCDGLGNLRLYRSEQFVGPIKFSSQGVKVGNCKCLAFGPQAKLFAIGGDGAEVQLWDLDKASKKVALNGLEKPARKVLFSRDGTTLAALADDDATIHVWDLTRNTSRSHFQHNRGAVGALALSPDGNLLATALKDGKVLYLWKTSGRELTHKGAPLELSEKELAALWTDFGGLDFEKADAAFRKLGACGDNALAFLRKQIRQVAVPAVDTKQIQEWMANLDSEKFANREKATKALIAQGEVASVPLQDLLAKAPSLEAKQRAELILKKIGDPMPTPERARILDALDLLEQLRTAQATELLREIERDALIPRIRLAARQALTRMSK